MTKNVVELTRRINISRLRKKGMIPDDETSREFQWNWQENGSVEASIRLFTARDSVRLVYAFQGQKIDRTVQLEWIAPKANGGGYPWFICPDCEQRRRHIYVEGQPSCRTCNRYLYSHQMLNTRDMHAIRADRIAKRWIKKGGTLTNGRIIERPLNMHHKTFKKFKAMHNMQRSASISESARLLKLDLHN